MRNIKPYLILNDQGEPSSMQLSYNKITTKIDLAPTGDSFKYSLWDKEGLAYKLADDGN